MPANFLHGVETIEILKGPRPIRQVKTAVVGLIGCLQGLKVEGTAQSVGERTTASVVQSISLVIVIDALAALWFMRMGW